MAELLLKTPKSGPIKNGKKSSGESSYLRLKIVFIGKKAKNNSKISQNDLSSPREPDT